MLNPVTREGQRELFRGMRLRVSEMATPVDAFIDRLLAPVAKTEG
jgi:hypothetical protein